MVVTRREEQHMAGVVRGEVVALMDIQTLAIQVSEQTVFCDVCVYMCVYGCRCVCVYICCCGFVCICVQMCGILSLSTQVFLPFIYQDRILLFSFISPTLPLSLTLPPTPLSHSLPLTLSLSHQYPRTLDPSPLSSRL